MKRVARLLFPLLFPWLPCFAQVAVSPIVQPHVTFVNGSGLPCAGCTLSTFVAGTTTPLATYTDASGTSQNTNPIILDAAGGANIWPGQNSYKYVLKDASGATIWSVDQVSSARLCAAAGAIQAANSAGNGITCDPSITINTTTHTISVGTLPTNHVAIGALGTPTSWNFDTTTPATALASLGAGTGTILAGTTNQIAIYPSNGTTVQGASALPANITAITRSANDNSTNPATTAYVANPGAISPTSVQTVSAQIASGTALTDNQGNGAKVQHSTGTTTAGDGAKFDANGNLVDAGSPYPVGTPRTCNSNGCYSIDGDGTIRASGQSTSASGGSAAFVTITFPVTFTSATNLQVVLTAVGAPAGDGNPHPLDCHLNAVASVSGATAVIALATQVSGSGYDHLTGQFCSWHAIGN